MDKEAMDKEAMDKEAMDKESSSSTGVLPVWIADRGDCAQQFQIKNGMVHFR